MKTIEVGGGSDKAEEPARPTKANAMVVLAERHDAQRIAAAFDKRGVKAALRKLHGVTDAEYLAAGGTLDEPMVTT